MYLAKLVSALILVHVGYIVGDGVSVCAKDATSPSDVQQSPSKVDIAGELESQGSLPAPKMDASGEKRDTKACQPLTLHELFDAGEFAFDNPIYPVTQRFDFTPSLPGEEILAIRKFECEGPRSFVLFTKGKFLRKGEDNSVVFQRIQNISMVNNFNQSGDAWNFTVSSASKDTTDTWCLPKKEFCTKKVDRSAHGLKDAAQAELAVPELDAFSLRYGEDLVLQAAVTLKCGKPTARLVACINLGQEEQRCEPITYEQVAVVFPKLPQSPLEICSERTKAQATEPAPERAEPKLPVEVPSP